MSLKTFRRALGIFIVMDGARALLLPIEHAHSLQFGNPLMDDMLDYLAENPGIARRFAIGEILFGVCLTLV